jgi:putative hydrolase
MLESLNQQIALKLAEAADLLEQQGANPFRISAYRRASETVSRLQQDIGELAEARGAAGLIELPNIGKGIAGAIQELIATGHWSQLERLRGTLDPVRLFQTVPGIGPKMAEKIEQVLHVDTLEDLEVAACDGRLQNVPGLGARRIAGIRSALGAQLDKTRSRLHSQPGEGPAVKTLLEVDREYRLKVHAITGTLPCCIPTRRVPTSCSVQMTGWCCTFMTMTTRRDSARLSPSHAGRWWANGLCVDVSWSAVSITGVLKYLIDYPGSRDCEDSGYC